MCCLFFTSLLLAVINLKIMVCKQKVNFYMFYQIYIRKIESKSNEVSKIKTDRTGNVSTT